MLLTILLAIVFVIVKQSHIYLVFLVPSAIYQTIIIKFQKSLHSEITQFVESINNRDFSRHFDEKRAPSQLKLLRKKFNEINSIFKLVTLERETQYHYLQQILEMVDTGIVSYNAENGEIGWINDSCKRLLGIPYLKNIYSLEKREAKLYYESIKLRPKDSKVLSIKRNQQTIKLLVSASIVKVDGVTYKLLAFQNVSAALEETELNAWQRLLNVMTHEIMNSVAPISSLADTLTKRLQSSEISDSLLYHNLEDIKLGINTIKRRSEGLLKFTQNYRNLNRINNPDLKKILVRNLFENLNILMSATLQKKHIELAVNLREPALTIEVDLNLMEQVLINLLVNAIEAVKNKDNPIITLSAETQSNNRVIIKIADNGIGMAPELLDKIFIPFFSTRKTGSGIGLSLCKQIMLLHEGNIQVQSIEGKGSVFVLLFSD